MYYSSAPEQIRYLVEQVESQVVVVDGPAGLERLIAAGPYGGLPKHVIVLDDPQGVGAPGVIRYQDLVGSETVDVDAAAAAVTPEDIATIIFTSGTTGSPKGAQLSHGGLRCLMESMSIAFGAEFTGKRFVSYMPMAHIAERANTHYLPLRGGHDVTTVAEVTALAQTLPAVRPQYLFGPPRIWRSSGPPSRTSRAPPRSSRPRGSCSPRCRWMPSRSPSRPQPRCRRRCWTATGSWACT